MYENKYSRQDKASGVLIDVIKIETVFIFLKNEYKQQFYCIHFPCLEAYLTKSSSRKNIHLNII